MSGQRRRTGTVDKTVWLSDETITAVQSWAAAEGCSFSAAVETLTRLGLRQAPAEAVAPLLVSAVREEIRRQGHRAASLLATCALDAATASRMCNVILRTVDREKGSAVSQAVRKAAVDAIKGSKALAELLDGDREG
jgi:hypothetical protein